jgi:hypothetical protein
MITHYAGPAIRRLFAKAGYNIALISRESANLHKFAAELKTGDTDVRPRFLFPVPYIDCCIINNTGSRVPNIQLHLQRSPNRLLSRAHTLADIRHPRSSLQRRLRHMETLFADHRGRSRQSDGYERQGRLCVRSRGDHSVPRPVYRR